MEAAKGKITALKTLLHFMEADESGDDRAAAEGVLPETVGDWSLDGVWLTMPEAEAGKPTTAAPKPAAAVKRGSPNLSMNSLVQPIAQESSEEVAPDKEAAEKPTAMSRQQRRRLAAMARAGAKKDAQFGQFAKAA